MYEIGLILGFLLFGLPLLIPVVYIVGVVGGLLWHGIQAIRSRHNAGIEDIQPDIPFYIRDKLDAFDAQLDSYYKLLEAVNSQIRIERNEYKRAQLLKRRSDLMLKLATIEEKAQKTMDKYDIPD